MVVTKRENGGRKEACFIPNCDGAVLISQAALVETWHLRLRYLQHLVYIIIYFLYTYNQKAMVFMRRLNKRIFIFSLVVNERCAGTLTVYSKLSQLFTDFSITKTPPLDRGMGSQCHALSCCSTNCSQRKPTYLGRQTLKRYSATRSQFKHFLG